ncbi:MAG TPA: glycosyltransferase [Ignavibacteriales bacterium]|nr:glycosyltransferase [Ignavibacteriales bacterium]HOL81573.1 glycosyltransferase [Ignavibacteriales bacterium]HOM65597.1 glycosyltransferase [Ignavibacteriales bacterium]HPD67805.1 glycosyltransferase [Ignavibacteriales bacterium]HPP33687.1 glycosyltransferase [Ignavibacteriales bacterium]
MFEIIFFISLCIYFILFVIITIGLNKKFPKKDDNSLPTVSIIVAARNEQDNILDCLKSLDKQIYPQNKIEIIIVDDKSTDNTKNIVLDFIKDIPKFKCITTSEEIGHLKGKTNALANGIKIASGDIILTTDADCTPPEQWAITMVSYFNEKVGVVCGFTTQESYNAFSGMQAIDFCFLQSVAAGVMNLGKPITCIGNNMAFTKKAYIEVGGYESLEFSVTEDFKLLQAIVNTGKYQSIYPLDKNSLNVSKPCKDLKTLYWQKKRWGVGGLEAAIEDYLIMAAGFVMNILIILSPFFISQNLIWLLISKFFIDYSYLKFLLKRWEIDKILKYFFAFEIYYIIYVIILPFVVLFSRKVVWKGRKY